MVIHNSYPEENFPCLVQINYIDGNVGFYFAKNFEKKLDTYSSKFVAIFKCKLKT
jgi:hypothetical protein